MIYHKGDICLNVEGNKIHLLLMPLAIFSESVEHEIVALLREELRPVADHRHPVRSVAQTELAAFFDKPEQNEIQTR